MDIPAIIESLPLETRIDVKGAIRCLLVERVFELIVLDQEKEILQAAMVLANSREYEQIERASIRTNAITELFDGLITASKEN